MANELVGYRRCVQANGLSGSPLLRGNPIMRVLVTGGRDFTDKTLLFETLDRLHAVHSFSLLIHGDASGADRLGGEWAIERGLAVQAHPADWKKLGRSAGPIRNREMLKENPQLVVAFPGGKGTADMVKVARKAGIEVILVEGQATK